MYVLIPRSWRIQLAPKWYGSLKVVKVIYPVYGIEVLCKNGTKLAKNMTRESIVAEYTTQKNYVDEERDINIKIDKNGNSTVPENVDLSDYVTNEENTGLIVNNGHVVKVTNRGGQGRSNLTLPWRGPLSYRNQSIDLLANQWTRFYMITASVMKELRRNSPLALRTSDYESTVFNSLAYEKWHVTLKSQKQTQKRRERRKKYIFEFIKGVTYIFSLW